MTLLEHRADVLPEQATPSRHRFTRDAYHRAGDLGLLGTEPRCELIDGDILDKMGQKEPHPTLIMQILFVIAGIFGQLYVRSQLPVVLTDDSEPEPDLAVTSQPRNVYTTSGDTPPASDVRLVVEISISTLHFDLMTKAGLYSRAGIPEYWVVDAANLRLVVHCDPTPAGYASVVSLDDTQSVSPIAAPHASLRVADLLP
jgi:Uma2 family endonuclease